MSSDCLMFIMNVFTCSDDTCFRADTHITTEAHV